MFKNGKYSFIYIVVYLKLRACIKEKHSNWSILRTEKLFENPDLEIKLGLPSTFCRLDKSLALRRILLFI